MADLGNFNADDYKDDYAEVPEGDYKAILSEANWKDTNDGGGRYINCRFQITDEKNNGAIVFEILNLENKNSKAVEIANETLAKICRAVGTIKPGNTDEILNKELVVIIKHKDNTYNGETKKKAKIVGYKQIIQGAAATPSADDVPF